MFRSSLWGLLLGALGGLAVLTIVYVRALPAGVSPKNWVDSLSLFVPPGLVGGLLLGVAAGIVQRRRRTWLLLLALGLYPLISLATIALCGDWFAWQALVVGAFVAVAYFPMVFLPVGAGVLILERLTRPAD